MILEDLIKAVYDRDGWSVNLTTDPALVEYFGLDGHGVLEVAADGSIDGHVDHSAGREKLQADRNWGEGPIETAIEWIEHVAGVPRDKYTIVSGSPGQLVSRSVMGDDDFFGRVGDMLSVNELRALNLTKPEHVAERDKYLARYERSGIDPDRDPGEFDIKLPAVDGETADGFVERVVTAVSGLHQIRHSEPDQYGTQSGGSVD